MNIEEMTKLVFTQIIEGMMEGKPLKNISGEIVCGIANITAQNIKEASDNTPTLSSDKDAERYQFIREHHPGRLCGGGATPEYLDKVIDAAIIETKKGGQA